MLQARALHAVRTSDPTFALADVLTLIRLAEHVDQGPCTLSLIVSISIWSRSLQVLWEGLKDDQWNGNQLEQLDLALQGHDLQANTLKHLREERSGFQFLIVEKLMKRKTPDALINEGVTDAHLRWLPKGWRYRNLISYCEVMHKFVLVPDDQAATKLIPKHIEGMGDELKRRRTFIGSVPHPHHYLATETMPMLNKMYASILTIETTIKLARIAIANQKHFHREGQFAPDLDALSLPSSLTDAKFLSDVRYRIKEDGTPLVYSVGYDGIDDQGIPHKDAESKDWVWQYTYPEFTEKDFTSRQ